MFSAIVAEAGVDSSFHNLKFSSDQSPYIGKIIQDENGGVFILGNFKEIDGSNFSNVAKLDSNGNLDLQFQPPLDIGIGTNSQMELLPNGQLLVLAINSFPSTVDFIRLNSNGSLDNSYSIELPEGSYPLRISTDADGGLFVAIGFGSDAANDGQILKYDSSGNLISSITLGATGSRSDEVKIMEVLQDGSLVISYRHITQPYACGLRYGCFAYYKLERFDENGDRVNSIRSDTPIQDILALPTGEFLVSGGFEKIFADTDINVRLIAKLNSNFSVIEEFNKNDVFHEFSASTSIISMAVLPNGDIALAGYFGSENPLLEDLGVRVIDTNGDSFQYDSPYNLYGYSVVEISWQHSSNGLLVGGYSYTLPSPNINPVKEKRLIRLVEGGEEIETCAAIKASNGTVFPLCF